MRPLELALLAAHAAVVVVIALFAPRRQSNEQFSIGARRVGRFGLTVSIFSTLVTESIIFFSVTLTARFGVVCAAAVVVGPAAATAVLSLLAPRAHADGAAHRAHCVSEFCLRTWGGVGKLARVVLLLFLAWIIVLQVNLNGRLLAAILEWPLLPSTAWAVLLVGFYVVAGGYWTVIRTDVFQSLVLGAIVVVPFTMTSPPDLARAVSAPPALLDTALVLGMSFTLTLIRPELWQRIYSAETGAAAARSLRHASVLFLAFGLFVLYYAVAAVQAVPGAGGIDAFVRGYREILPYPVSALFPVILVAAMMSSLDSAAFLFGVSVAKESAASTHRHARWTRIIVAAVLLGAGAVSLTIFDSLVFAYKLDGIVAVFAVPLILSHRYDLSRFAVYAAVSSGSVTYLVQIVAARIDRRPSEAFLSAVVSAAALAAAEWAHRTRVRGARADPAAAGAAGASATERIVASGSPISCSPEGEPSA